MDHPPSQECAGWAGSTRSQQGVATSYAVGLRKASRGFIQQDFHVQPGALAGCQREAPFCEQICSADEGAHAHDDAAGVGSDACAALCAGDDALFSRIPSNRNRDRRPKSWEFVIRLLANKQTNPALIKWEEEAQGTFRFVQPKVVARMWGTVFSGKPNLSYNNFARDLRHFYKPGAIQAVANKQLVYRCGPEALAYFERLQTN
ncbi:ETS-related transcription factor Elf-5-like [Penaeus japonicus]|uniref:ETS-related transcription factor Elf-5-like n=1 Tax=Penaeus japonicus TaxID=27405 RepID=UPI001C71234C|nr:ETS-related transcription factor Elf-5-like [Penaeus japonicus]